MARTTVRVLATLAVAVTFGGFAMRGDIRLLQDELRAIAARQDSLVAELRLEAQQTQDTLRTQGDQMFGMRGDLNRQLNQINQALVRIEAIAGENQRGLAAVRDQLRSGQGAPGGMTAGPTGGATAGPGGGGAPGGESLVGGGDPEELYQIARDQHSRGSLTSAQRAFEQFLVDYPTHERAADAHWWMGDILEQQERPEDAIDAFEAIGQLFPTHDRVPDSLYRIAQLQVMLDDTDAARATLERIINTYPDELVAMLARELLEDIG